jgi:hypothetical protein
MVALWQRVGCQNCIRDDLDATAAGAVIFAQDLPVIVVIIQGRFTGL